MRALLDVNVLLALLDADHVDHARARRWLKSEIGRGWASCAITENGLVRILSQPKYPSPVTPSEAVERLRRAMGTEHHAFWQCDLSLANGEAVRSSRLFGSRQVTDTYLLALALHHGGRLVTFDRAIVLEAVVGARPEHLVVL